MTPDDEHPARALHRFERLLDAGGSPVGASWRPGLSPDEMDVLTAPLGVELSAQARAFYAWHDGCEATAVGRPELMRTWTFPPLRDQVRWYSETWIPWYEEVFWDEDDDGLYRGTFPVLRGSDDQTAVMVHCPDRPGHLWKVTKWNLRDPVPLKFALRHLTLTALVETWCWWLESDAMVWDEATGWQPGRDPLHWTTYRAGFC